jgi:hypothetical protein
LVRSHRTGSRRKTVVVQRLWPADACAFTGSTEFSAPKRPGLLLLVIVISSHSTGGTLGNSTVLLSDQLAIIQNELANSHRFSPLSPFRLTRKPSNTTQSPASERPSPALSIQQPPPDLDAFKLQSNLHIDLDSVLSNPAYPRLAVSFEPVRRPLWISLLPIRIATINSSLHGETVESRSAAVHQVVVKSIIPHPARCRYHLHHLQQGLHITISINSSIPVVIRTSRTTTSRRRPTITSQRVTGTRTSTTYPFHRRVLAV